MKRKFWCIGLGLIFILLIGGCTDGNFFDIQSTMKPPKLNEDELLIKSTIDKKLGKDFILKYPQRGEQRSAIVLHNLSGKGKREAIVFYQTTDKKEFIHIMIMQEINNSWNVIADYTNNGIDVDKVCFSDMNGDGKDEVLVGWTGIETNTNNITAYELDNDEISEIKLDDRYTEFTVVNSDNGSVLFVICSSGVNNRFYTKLIKIKNKKFFDISLLKFDDSLIRCNNILYNYINSTESGFFIDYTNSEGQIKTEMLYGKNKLSKVSSKSSILKSTKRNTPILCKDVNDDKIVEVPLESVIDTVLDSQDEPKTHMLDWSNFDLVNERFNSVKKSICNYEMGYNFFVPDIWDKNIACHIDDKNSSEKFYEQHIDKSGNKDIGDLILEIRKFSSYDWKSISDKQEYVLLDEYNGFLYTAIIPRGDNKLIIDGESLKQNFEVVNKG